MCMYKRCKNWGSEAASSKTTFHGTVFIACEWSGIKHLRLTKYNFVFLISLYPTMCKHPIITPFNILFIG